MKANNIGATLAGLVNLGSICGLAYIGLKRNNDCYKAEMRAIDAEFGKAIVEIDNITKDAKIKMLEKELNELKEKYGVTKEGEA